MAALALGAVALLGCEPEGVGTGTQVVFDAASSLSGRRSFFDFPWPSDARRKADGTVDYSGWPLPAVPATAPFKQALEGTRGFGVAPVAYFRFGAPLAPQREPRVLPAQADQAALLLDLGPDGSGAAPQLLPVLLATPEEDAWTASNVLGLAPRYGVVLRANRRHAFVVRRALGDAEGRPLGVDPAFARLRDQGLGTGPDGAPLGPLYAPLWTALAALGVPRDEVAAATVFTTHDAVQETADLAETMRGLYQPRLEGLAHEQTSELASAPYCHVTATLRLPQFQEGTPTFDTQGLFQPGPDGLPRYQREEVVRVSLTFPRSPMPPGGYPLVVYFHGSGGVAREFVDGPAEPPYTQWAAWPLAEQGFAVAGQALPVSPDRVPGASDIAYLNLLNPVALRDTFRQGIIESRLFLDALEALRVDPAVLASCAGASLPAGATAYRFSLARLSVQGQSMGAMYANLVSPVEPRIGAVVPTGAGGLWMYFILETGKVPATQSTLGQVLGTSAYLTFLHPGLHLIQAAYEPVDPLLSTPRLARRPLEGHPARHVYQPIGDSDSYFPRPIFDAMVLGYGHPLAGAPVFDTTVPALELVGLAPSVELPARENLASEDGRPYTGVAAQYPRPGTYDGHGVYRRVPAVMRQYTCFHVTWRDTGAATVVPGDSAGPCTP